MSGWLRWGVIVALVGVGLLWHLDRYPATWVDEGQHLACASAIVRTGQYGTPNNGRLEAYDPAIQVGPIVILPVALAMRVGGLEVLPARYAMVVMAVGMLAVFLVTAHRLAGPMAAWIAGLLLVIGVKEPFASYVYLARQVVGEVPALGWFLGALLLFPRGRDDRRRWRVVVAGACLACAMVTKGQLVFVGLPAIGLGWVIDRLWHRHWAWWQVPAVGVVTMLGYALWQGWQWWHIGSAEFSQNAAVLRFGVSTQIAAFDLRFARRGIGTLFRLGFLFTGVPGFLYGAWRAMRRDEVGALHAQLLPVLFCSAAWFVFGSVAWARYAFYPVALSYLWVGAGVTAAWQSPTPRWRRAGTIALVVIVASHVWMASSWWRLVAEPPPSGFAAMRVWIRDNVPPDARVETWEWSFLMDPTPKWTHPDLWHMYDVTRYVMHDTHPPLSAYDPLRAHPDYVLQGPFGGWTGIYREVTNAPGAQKLAQFEEYVLYTAPRKVTDGVQ